MRRAPVPLLLCLWLVACEPSRDLSTPEGAYAAFSAALLTHDTQALWDSLAPETHALFERAHASLVETRQLIERLQPSDRALASERTGVRILDQAKTPQQLFEAVFYRENVPTEIGFSEGLAPARVVTVDPTHATVVSRANQEFELVAAPDGSWRVRSPLHEPLAQALSRVETNRANIETAVELFGNPAHRAAPPGAAAPSGMPR
jgi:hypothetical protein